MHLNVLMHNVEPSQLSFFSIVELNKIVESKGSISPIIYQETPSSPCVNMLFPTMQIAEAWAQKGVGIATSLSTASKLLSLPCMERKLFYVWDLTWLRHPKHYEYHASIYTNQHLELIARSESHAKLITNCFNRDVKHILRDFNHEELLEILK